MKTCMAALKTAIPCPCRSCWLLYGSWWQLRPHTWRVGAHGWKLFKSPCIHAPAHPYTHAPIRPCIISPTHAPCTPAPMRLCTHASVCASPCTPMQPAMCPCTSPCQPPTPVSPCVTVLMLNFYCTDSFSPSIASFFIHLHRRQCYSNHHELMAYMHPCAHAPTLPCTHVCASQAVLQRKGHRGRWRRLGRTTSWFLPCVTSCTYLSVLEWSM